MQPDHKTVSQPTNNIIA